MLDEQQRRDLATWGVVRVPGFADVTDAVEGIWRWYARRGVRPDDPSTWPVGLQSGLQGLRQAGVFETFATAQLAALCDDLLGAWDEPSRWGPGLVRFPEHGPSGVPTRQWHLDVPAEGDVDRLETLRLFGLLSPTAPDGGGTMVIAGSHRVIGRWAAGRAKASSADVVRRFRRVPGFWASLWTDPPPLDQVADDDGLPLRVTALTGDPGDVWLMHPWTMHAGSVNATDTPRFAATHTVLRTGTNPWLRERPAAQAS